MNVIEQCRFYVESLFHLSLVVCEFAHKRIWIQPGIIGFSLLGVWELVFTLGQIKNSGIECTFCKDYPNVNYGLLSSALREAFIDYGVEITLTYAKGRHKMRCHMW